MSTDFTNRRIQILEASTCQGMYNDNKFDQQTNAIWEDFEAGHLSYQEVAFWFYLNKLAGHNRETYPTQDYVAKKFKVTTKTIGRWADALEAKGWVVKINRTGTSNKYWISIPEEFNAINDKNYSARLSTVGQELATGKRSTKSKKGTLRDMDVPMDLDSTNSSHKDMDVSMKGHGCLFNKDMDVSLNRESYNQRELEPDKSKGVTTVNQGSSLAETLDSPLVSSGQDYKEILVEEIAVLPLVDEVTANAAPSLSSGLDEVNLGYSSVTKKEEEISSGMAIVNEDDLGNTDKVQKALEEYRAKKAKRSGWEVPSKKAAPSKKNPDTSLDVVDAPQSLVEASGAEKVQEVPEKPQKPVYEAPERKDWEDDNRYESRKQSSWKSFVTYTMPNYQKALADWEKASAETRTTPTPVSDEFKAEQIAKAQERMRFRAQGY